MFSLLKAFGILKKAAAEVNKEFGLDPKVTEKFWFTQIFFLQYDIGKKGCCYKIYQLIKP